MKRGLVSIIIPAYNAVPYIEECIQSILSQPYRPMEIILIDDGSTDETLSTCMRFQDADSRIQVHHQENSGPSRARNWGLNYVSGEYLLFIDADDYLEPNAVSALVEKMCQSNADVCCFSWRDVGTEQEKIHTYSQEEMQAQKEEVIRNIMFDDFLNGGGFLWNKMWRVSAIASNECFPQFDAELTKYEDRLWVLQSLNVCKSISYLNEPQYNYRILGNSLSHKPASMRSARMNYKATVKMLEFVREAFPQLSDEVERWSQNYLAGMLYRGVREHSLIAEDYAAAKEYPIWKLPKEKKAAIQWLFAKMVIQLQYHGGKGM